MIDDWMVDDLDCWWKGRHIRSLQIEMVVVEKEDSSKLEFLISEWIGSLLFERQSWSYFGGKCTFYRPHKSKEKMVSL